MFSLCGLYWGEGLGLCVGGMVMCVWESLYSMTPRIEENSFTMEVIT